MLQDVKIKYENLCYADKTSDLSPRTEQGKLERKEYSQLYRDWYVNTYDLMCRVFDHNNYDDDMKFFRSVMQDNDGNASSLQDNFHKIEAAYRNIIQKIEKKL